mmetsp:Transcript_82412/g.145389  ORF Transcript_82412/g.145389 Transcript_82412/m.145389 type:complete len:574 (-) Transcript_82412:209-1930(-)
MAVVFRFFAVLTLTYSGADQPSTVPLEDAFADDDECSDSACSLNALQLRGEQVAEGFTDLSSLECLWKDADEPWQKHIQQKLAQLDSDILTALVQGQAEEVGPHLLNAAKCPADQWQSAALVMSCEGGEGQAQVDLVQGTVARIAHVPMGAQGLSIEVTADGDLDIQLMDTATRKCLTGYACIQNESSTMEQYGMLISFTGDDRIAPVTERVSTNDRITRMLTVNVSAYKTATGTINYKYGAINPCPNPRPGCSACNSYPCPAKTKPKCNGGSRVTCEPTCDTTKFEKEVIETMLADFRHHVEENQLQVNAKINEVSTCNSDMASAIAEDAEGVSQVSNISSELAVCEGHLEALRTEEVSCKATMTAMMERNTACSDLSAKAMHTEAACSSSCATKDGESALEYVSRLKAHYEKLEAEYQIQTKACENHTFLYTATTVLCQAKAEEIVTMSAKCAALRQQKCVAGKEQATKSIQTCKTYNKCYARGAKGYEDLLASLTADEANRQKHWASIQNFKCILKSWTGKGNLCQAVQAKNQCRGGIPTAPHVDFPPVAAKMKCTVLEDPCTSESPKMK